MTEHIIQNPDVNIGPGSYKTMNLDELLVFGEPFYTIQGEGPLAGHPAVFLRLAGCNRGNKVTMGCSFCDTAFQFSAGKARKFAELDMAMASTLVERRISTKPVVVITGGEPMMQNRVVPFCHYLLGYTSWPQIQIESNGDRLVEGLPGAVVLVVSPKVSRVSQRPDSGHLFDKYEYKEPTSVVFDRANAFKFLVEADTLSPYYQPPSWADTCGRPVYVSPITKYVRQVAPGEVPSGWNHRLLDIKATRANYAHAALLAMRYGYRVSTQQHLFFEVP